MTQVLRLTDAYNLADDLVHLRHLHDVIRGIVGMEHHQIHRPHLNPVMLLEHIAVEVLLHAIVVERRVGQVDAVVAHLAAKSLCDGLSLCIHHFRAALPVVDGKRAIVLLTDQVDGACDVQFQIIHRPLLPIGLNPVVADKLEEIALLRFDGDGLRLPVIAERVDGLECAVVEIVLRLGVHEGTHLTGHTARLVPGIERLLHRDTLILALALGHCQRIEAVKEIVGQSAHRQQPLLKPSKK